MNGDNPDEKEIIAQIIRKWFTKGILYGADQAKAIYNGQIPQTVVPEELESEIQKDIELATRS